jgi:protein-tyrosine phosphatase
LRARKLARDDFDTFDWILAMDAGHLQAVRQLRPAGAAVQVALLLSAASGGTERDVPDPYYGDAQDFEHVIDLVEQGCRDWLQHWGLTR